ncbi:hypothetical protein [Streptomyces sp. NPDC058855]|uniref:hypothetical protein n=1 Tax=Streptomyces sp. NPDC058855 TaxID=3346651 RepID=UPI003683BF42
METTTTSAPWSRPGGTGPRHATVARAQGLFNIVGGAWPVLSLRTFEWVYGPKADDWLQKTSGGLLASAGWSMLRAANDPEGLRHARRVGIGTALTFLAVDLVYVPRGRIRPTYLMDAAKEIAWLVAWWRAGPLPPRPAPGPGARRRPRTGRRPAWLRTLPGGR